MTSIAVVAFVSTRNSSAAVARMNFLAAEKRIQLEALKKAMQKEREVKQLSMKEKQTIMKAKLESWKRLLVNGGPHTTIENAIGCTMLHFLRNCRLCVFKSVNG